MRTLTKSVLLWAVLAVVPVVAQCKPVTDLSPPPTGALTAQSLRELRQAVPMTPTMTAERNALAHHSIHSLIIDQELENRTDAYFNHVIKSPGSIANQKQSGRCWLFAGLNLLRPEVMATFKMKHFMLSQAYEQFYQKLEAANRSLEFAIRLRNQPIHSRRLDIFLKNLIGDGGNWNYVTALIEKYGAVPASVMPDDYAASHSREMDALMAMRLRKAFIAMRRAGREGATVSQLRRIKMKALRDIYKILVLCLGQPPTSFQWRYQDKDGKVGPLKTYTPRSFCRKFLDVHLSRFVDFVNYPGKPMYARLQWAWERNMIDHPGMVAINIPMPQLRAMVLKSILADQAVWFGANASTQGDFKKGLWLQNIDDVRDLFGIDFSMSKADALAYDDGGPNHAMVFTGVDIEHGQPVKWKVENSWGEKAGDKGWFTIGGKWFTRHVFQVIIARRFVPHRLLELTHKKPIQLPPWDPFTDWANGRR